MKLIFRRALFLFAIAVSTPLFADDLSDAKRAYSAGEFEEAATLLKPLVKIGNAEALFLLGRMYEQGDGVTKDISEARRLFKLAAQKGHKDAEQRLALYANADTGDESVVLNWYLPAAKEGDVDAQYNLGFMYETGWGVRIDEKQAATWYREAADGKHDMAQLRLGMMMIVGKGVPQNVDAGVEMLRRAAENGNRVAEVLVQELYDTGEAEELNATKIISGLRRVIDEGEAKSLKTLNASLDAARDKNRGNNRRTARKEPDSGSSKFEAPSRESTSEPARPLFRQSESDASRDQVSADAEIPTTRRSNSSSDDLNDMVRRYLSLARQGNPDAQFSLGILYVQGRGLTKDVQEGLRWFRASANQGNELAKDYLALWSDDIDASSFGSSIGLIWLKELARDWNVDALYQLGFMYESGRGVRVNTNEAKVWYRLAAEAGHVDARKRFELLKQGRTIVDTPASGGNLAIKTTVSTSDRWNWLSMMGTFIGISLLAFAIFYVWRRGLAPINVGGAKKGVPQNPIGDTAEVERALAQDDLEFLKGLWDDSGAAKASAPARPESKREAKPEQEPVAEVKPTRKPLVEQKSEKPSIPMVDTSKPIISEDEIKLPDLKSILANSSELPIVDAVKRPAKPESAAKPVPDIDLVNAEKPKSAATPKEPESPVVSPSGQKPGAHRFDADSISTSGISRDALASRRIDADRLFEDGLVLDKAGRVVAKNEEPPIEPVFEKQAGTEKPKSTLFDLDAIDIDSLRKSRESLAALAGNSTPPPKKSVAADSISKTTPSSSAKAKPMSPTPPAKPKEERPAVDEERSLGEVHYNIGLMFYNGDGVPKNDVMAAKWFKKSADEGHAESQYLLGDMLMTGRGVPANPSQGINWIQKAAEAGYRPAIERLRKHQAG